MCVCVDTDSSRGLGNDTVVIQTRKFAVILVGIKKKEDVLGLFLCLEVLQTASCCSMEACLKVTISKYPETEIS